MSSDNPVVAIASPHPSIMRRRKKPKTISKILLFERCSGNLADLRFDSAILENFYRQCSYPQALVRFRFAATYLALVCLAWGCYAAIIGFPYWPAYLAGALLGFLVATVLLGTTLLRNKFQRQATPVFIFTAVFFSVLALLTFAIPTPSISLAFNYSLVAQIILVTYAMFPLKLWHVLTITIPLSFIHIVLASVHYQLSSTVFICTQLTGHGIIHAIGLILLLMSQVRRRSTFLNLGRSARMRQELKKEQLVRAEMIRSLMPDQVAKEVMEDVAGGNKDILVFQDSDEECEDQERRNAAANKAAAVELEESVGAPERAVEFRKFHVNQIDNVSILFADIVGFTKMSSNKSASHLVELLSDLFGRFDRLCELTGCEKIATLGDCYYCVAGCPNPVTDHAERACEMGRAMCLAIQQFDEDHKEEVNMRVGVHTGKVICGIVGTRRFKFDVWSNDVTLANEMESSGQAGKVHISEATYAFVDKVYVVQEGEQVEDIRQLKVLVEFFNKEDQCYAIKHTKNETFVKTFFVAERFDKGPVVELPPISLLNQQQSKNSSETNGDTSTPLIADNHQQATSSGGDEVTVPERKISASMVGSGAPPLEPRGSDVSLLEALRETTQGNQVFAFPPISPFSLRFHSDRFEKAYRRLGLSRPRKGYAITWATPRMTQLVNVSAHAIITLLVLCACFAAFPDTHNSGIGSIAFYVSLGVTLLITFVMLLLVGVDTSTWIHPKTARPSINVFSQLYSKLYQWYPRNILGSLVMFLPSVLVLSNFRFELFQSSFWFNETIGGVEGEVNVTEVDFDESLVAMMSYRTMLGIMFSLMLFNCTLFTMFSSWTKSLTATFVVIAAIILLQIPFEGEESAKLNDLWFGEIYGSYNFSSPGFPLRIWMPAVAQNYIVWELTVILMLHLVLIWTLNREFDVSSRTSFNRDIEARCAKEAINYEKIQADWLLENIIPSYVLVELRTTNKYSRHIVDAGVIFATISNFADFYDEQYQGGQEMLRVLNEIFADFEHQLPRFKDVEKIKTIGACFMAASGLNMSERGRNANPNDHLIALMDFAMELIKVLDEFNQQMFSFKFDLKVGFNIGEVTAGVIGTTKLLYDIWGDTVNVASRMYSTGMKRRIQVTEDVANRLGDRYEFEYRGIVNVKGKGDMKTYLLVKRK